jgi:adenylate kinase
LIAEHYHIPFFSTGDLLRDEVRKGTEIGKKAESIISHGHLMPDHVIKELVADELAARECKDGLILDGYPRTIQQAKDLDTLVKVDWVVYLKTNDEETIKRIVNRRGCANGHIYNLVTKPPVRPGFCDVDSLELTMRPDDKEESIKNRLKIFHELTEPIIEYYRKQGKLIEIEGISSIEDISEKILSILDAKLRMSA